MKDFFRGKMKIIIMSLLLVLLSETDAKTKCANESTTDTVNAHLETTIVFTQEELNGIKKVVQSFVDYLDVIDSKIPEPIRITLRPLRTKLISKQKPELVEELLRKFNLVDWLKVLDVYLSNLTDSKAKDLLKTIQKEVAKAEMKNKTSISINIQPNKSYIDSVKDYLQNMSSSDADAKKLYNLLQDFKRHLENDQETPEILKELLNSAKLKKYDNLDDTAKANLKKNLRRVSQFLSSNIMQLVDKNLTVPYSTLRKSFDKLAREMKNVKTNEFIVNNVDVFLQPGSKNH